MTTSTSSKSYRGVPSVVLAVHAEDVVEDGVRPDHLDAELSADDTERLREILADGQPARSLAAQEQREVLGADHRPPRPLDGAGAIARHRRRRSPGPRARSGRA